MIRGIKDILHERPQMPKKIKIKAAEKSLDFCV